MLRTKKILISISYVLLGAVIIALIIMIGASKTEASNLKNELSELRAELDTVKSNLDTANNSYSYTKTLYQDATKRLSDKTNELNTQKNLTKEAQAEAELWKKKFMDLDPENVTYEYSFDNVKDFLTAIKSNPYAYYNKNVKVIGWVYKESDSYETILASDGKIDFSTAGNYEFRYVARNENCAVNLTFKTELEYSVLDTRDYVKVYGTVLIDNSGEILLSDCTYELITPAK